MSGLTNEDLPGLFDAADRASLRGQREYVNAVRLRLVLAVVVAATGALTWKVANRIDLAGLATAIALAVMALVELALRTGKPEEAWYDGRALAESAKSLAWRYATAGAPFEITSADPDRRLVDELKLLLTDAQSRSVHLSNRPAISHAMRELRASDLATRKTAYLVDRIADQQRWYTTKAQFNESRARLWRAILLFTELFGFAAALSRAVGFLSIDIAGVVAAIIAAGVAWTGVKQHTTLARAYTFAANELVIVRGRLELVVAEEEWGREVADAEQAMSREHIMWRASRSRASD